VNTTTTNIDHYRRQYEDWAGQLPGQPLPWLRHTREHALERFAHLGFPTVRDEEWKYTRVTPIAEHPFTPAANACVGLDEDDIARLLIAGANSHRLVFINGHFTPPLSRPGRLPDGVTLGSLAAAVEQRPEPLEPYLGRVMDPEANGFCALNTAFLTDGVYLHLPDGVVLDEPIEILFLTTRQTEAVFSQPRNLIVAGDGAQATVIEGYASLGDSRHFTNAITEIVAGDGAALEHIRLQGESDQAFHVATVQVRQGRDSRFTSHAFGLGGRLSRTDINTVLGGEGAECTLNGLYVAAGRRHVDFHTRIDHARPRCTSRELYKGILDGGARGVFNGKIYVHPDAQQTDARQSNRNLLLSKRAEVDTKPQLEIYADDVRCSHGATVGQLDEDAVFYLRSRGMDTATARHLLTYAFAGEVVAEIGGDEVRRRVEERLAARLGEEHVIQQARQLTEGIEA
jgi:Fe-S cluster assembly protein SufD